MSAVASVAMLRWAILLLLTVALIGGMVAPTYTWAHPATFGAIITSPWPSAAAATTIPVTALVQPSAPSVGTGVGGLLIVGMTVALLLMRGCRGRLQLIGLSLLLIMTGFEGALHSVHHLGDPGAAERCRVASSAKHVTVVDVDVPDVVGPMLEVREASLPSQLPRARTARLTPDAGRAPPV
jgi:hypothetical protein